jgi:hypothetical protein
MRDRLIVKFVPPYLLAQQTDLNTKSISASMPTYRAIYSDSRMLQLVAVVASHTQHTIL